MLTNLSIKGFLIILLTNYTISCNKNQERTLQVKRKTIEIAYDITYQILGRNLWQVKSIKNRDREILWYKKNYVLSWWRKVGELIQHQPSKLIFFFSGQLVTNSLGLVTTLTPKWWEKFRPQLQVLIVGSHWLYLYMVAKLLFFCFRANHSYQPSSFKRKLKFVHVLLMLTRPVGFTIYESWRTITVKTLIGIKTQTIFLFYWLYIMNYYDSWKDRN